MCDFKVNLSFGSGRFSVVQKCAYPSHNQILGQLDDKELQRRKTLINTLRPGSRSTTSRRLEAKKHLSRQFFQNQYSRPKLISFFFLPS